MSHSRNPRASSLKEYYETTFKNINKYIYKLNRLDSYDFEKIIVVGHSVAGIDLPYFKRIDDNTKRQLIWNVYYYSEEEKETMKSALLEQGINANRLKMIPSNEFYNI
ncbi:MAG: hypothetical protein J6E38_00500 [Clostridia bacterium]|nr:hypothetical protein [Clostridia bacterium]